VYDKLKEDSEIPILKTTLKSRTAYGEARVVAGVGVFELAMIKQNLKSFN
jgi:hypothetical protein